MPWIVARRETEASRRYRGSRAAKGVTSGDAETPKRRDAETKTHRGEVASSARNTLTIALALLDA